MTNANYPAASKLDRYLTCFSPENCHLVCAPQGKSVSYSDGDQPTASIKPLAKTQGIAMYPVDGDFIIEAFINYADAKAFADQVGRAFPKLGVPPVITVQPDRIARLKSLEDLAYAIWDVRTNSFGRRKSRPSSEKKVSAANGIDLGIAQAACDEAGSSTPGGRHIFAAAARLGVSL